MDVSHHCFCTGVLILQNAQPFFHTQTLARANYWAELAEILDGIFLGILRGIVEGYFEIRPGGLEMA